jgi:TonB family protein
MKLPSYSLILCLSSLLVPCTGFAQTSQHLSTITNAEVSERVNPQYPVKLARSNIEGWARASYIVETDGSVSNVIITDSSGYKSFERETIKAIKKWKFTPAQENGKAIQQCHNNIQMDFSMGYKDGGVSRQFLRKYKKAQKALETKDFEDTKTQLVALESHKQRRLAEDVYSKLLHANYAKAINDNSLQLSSLSSIGLKNKKTISPEQEWSILQQKFILQVKLNHYKSALSTYNKLEKLELAKPYIPALLRIKQQVEDYITGENDIAILGDIKENFAWYHSLARNTFTLTNIQGSLNKLDVRCANKRHVYTVEENNTWNIPSSWKSCSLYIYGADNTKFTLVEHPLKIQTTAAVIKI